MTIEQELKDRCTPEFIKWMCEYAEGFRLLNDYTLFAFESFDCRINGVHESLCLFPLLIHRAAEGWNKRDNGSIITIYEKFVDYDSYWGGYEYYFGDYQNESLTQCELALLHCLLDIFAEAGA